MSDFKTLKRVFSFPTLPMLRKGRLRKEKVLRSFALNTKTSLLHFGAYFVNLSPFATQPKTCVNIMLSYTTPVVFLLLPLLRRFGIRLLRFFKLLSHRYLAVSLKNRNKRMMVLPASYN